MAADKLVDSSVLNTNLTSVANAIRTKGGTTESLAFPDGFVTAIGNISTGYSKVRAGSATSTDSALDGTVSLITFINAAQTAAGLEGFTNTTPTDEQWTDFWNAVGVLMLNGSN